MSCTGAGALQRGRTFSGGLAAQTLKGEQCQESSRRTKKNVEGSVSSYPLGSNVLGDSMRINNQGFFIQ